MPVNIKRCLPLSTQKAWIIHDYPLYLFYRLSTSCHCGLCCVAAGIRPGCFAPESAQNSGAL